MRPRRPRWRRSAVDLVLASGIFDQGWVEAQLGTQFASTRQAVQAYLATPGLSPHPVFLPQWIETKFGRPQERQDPLTWYLQDRRTRRMASPHPLIDMKALRAENARFEDAPLGAISAWLNCSTDETLVPVAPGRRSISLGELREASLSAVREWTELTRFRDAPRVTTIEPPRYHVPQHVADGSDSDSLVSIVMPMWNRGTLVRRAIESVQAQSYANWELIIVDDGSTDDSLAVVQGMATFDTRIVCVAAEHGGVSRARNLGLARARGDFVAFLDTDNAWRPDFLAVMVAELTRNKWTMAHSALRAVRDGEHYFRAFEGTHQHLLVANHVDLNVLMVRTDAVHAIGGFDESLRRGVDYDLILKLSKSSDLHLVPYIGVDYTDDEQAGARISTQESPSWLSVIGSRHLVDWSEVSTRDRNDALTSVVLVAGGSLRATMRWINALAGRPDIETILVGVRIARWQFVALTTVATAAGNCRLVGLDARRGAATSANVGFAHSSGSRAVCVLAQVEADPSAVDALASTLSGNSAVVAQPVLTDARGLVESAGAVFGTANGRPEPFLNGHPTADADRVGQREIPAALGSVVAVRSAELAALHGFDPRFGDQLTTTDLSLRIRAEGLGHTELCPHAIFMAEIPALPEADELADALQAMDERHLAPPPGSDEAWSAAGFEVIRRDLVAVGDEPSDPAETPVLRPVSVVRPVTARAAVTEIPPALRWSIDLPSPAGPKGLAWGDTHYGDALARALRRLGQHVAVDAREARHRATRSLDDVILVLRGLDRVTPRPECLNIEWVISHPDLVTPEEIGGYDLAYAASERWAAEATQTWGVDIRSLWQATDTELFNPSRAPFDTGDEVLFVGNSRGVHRASLTAAMAAGAKVSVHGHGWSEVLPKDQISSRFVDNTELGALYASAGIVLNDHWEDMRRAGFVSNRLMDAAACGARIASDEIPGLDLTAMFHGLVQTFTDEHDMRRILAQRDSLYPTAEERVAAAARVAADHSFDARARVILDDLLSLRAQRRSSAG